MAKSPEEWLRQADYDMDTAQFMLQGGRSFYAVFMCHLAIEKALKGLYQARLGKVPPKTHNLIFLLSETHIQAPEHVRLALTKLNEAHVVTRYPDDLQEVKKAFTMPVVRKILATHGDILKWIKEQF